MESTQVQYRLVRVKSTSNRSEKHPLPHVLSKKSNEKQFKDPANKKPPQNSHNRYHLKQKRPNTYYGHQKNASFNPYPKCYRSKQKEPLDSYGYYPQYYLQVPAIYTEVFVPVYGYPVFCMKTLYHDKKASDSNSPQELDNCDCHTVASEEDLQGSFGEESEFKVVLNGSVIHKECCRVKDLAFQNIGLLSEYEDFGFPTVESEPKSESIPMPTFLT